MRIIKIFYCWCFFASVIGLSSCTSSGGGNAKKIADKESLIPPPDPDPKSIRGIYFKKSNEEILRDIFTLTDWYPDLEFIQRNNALKYEITRRGLLSSAVRSRLKNSIIYIGQPEWEMILAVGYPSLSYFSNKITRIYDCSYFLPSRELVTPKVFCRDGVVVAIKKLAF